MCSATHQGFRLRRSKAETVDKVGWRSDTGPGKPYLKSPEGSMGVTRSLGVYGLAGGGASMGVEVGLRSEREDRMRVEAAAPAAAETPATIARVSFDIAYS